MSFWGTLHIQDVTLGTLKEQEKISSRAFPPRADPAHNKNVILCRDIFDTFKAHATQSTLLWNTLYVTNEIKKKSKE